jgi:hypothetical protein
MTTIIAQIDDDKILEEVITFFNELNIPFNIYPSDTPVENAE